MKQIPVLLAQALFMGSVFLTCFTAGSQQSNTTGYVQSSPAPAFILDQLTGTWKSENGKNFERWTKNSNGSYQSSVYSLKGIDTVWKEQADVYSEDGNWVFANRVKGQNQDQVIKFTSTLVTANSIRFSNPAHDFPTDIQYTLPDSNTLHASIAGPGRDGKTDTIPFNYTRFK